MSHRNANEISWSGWGDPDHKTALSPELLTLVQGALQIKHPGQAAPALDALVLTPATLSATALDSLRAAAGEAHVLVDDEARVRHLRGKSTPDLLKLRVGDTTDAPDAVVVPGSHDEVAAVLAACTQERIAVVPFGGGTSVVGGLTPERGAFTGVIALDLRRLDQLVSLDAISRTATLEPGLRGPEAEALLQDRGYTLGHFPQSFEYATIGGFAAARSSGQASAGYGRFDERVVGLRIATPSGTVTLGTAPKSAAGPDLRQLFLGSEGAFGVITAVTVEVAPTPAVKVYEGWRFESFDEGSTALRTLIQDGPVPTVLRLSDEVESALNLARPDAIGGEGAAGGCLSIVGYEGTEENVTARHAAASEVLKALGGVHEPEAGPAWETGRYSAPYLRDALLDAGALVETLETTTFWSGIPALYEGVRDALVEALGAQGTPPLVLCHVSHVYRSGASLYFTVACAQADDPLAQWQKAKTAANDAILAAGGSITHHHGIGVDHKAWYEQQIGEVGIAALRAVKRELDPAGIMNPGVLL
jgi:alkyldihydroxyacetonephosphate synthase